MTARRIAADSLRRYVEQVFARIGYSYEEAIDAADVLIWASLRGVDTHAVRNLKPYYVDRTQEGLLRPEAQIRIENETPNTACLDGGSGLGLVTACRAMRLAIDKARQIGVGMICLRNTHHLGPAGYFAHMAVKHGMLGACMTGHFFAKGHSIGIAPPGSVLPMLSTNPLSFAAPCGRHPPFVLDMSTSVVTINRVEMRAQQGQPIPVGWACDASGSPTTDPNAARIMLPLGGTPELGGFKGAGLAMMVSILSGVLSGAWTRIESELSDPTSASPQSVQYDQPTMGHFFGAVRIDIFQPVDHFCSAMDAMADALHAAPTNDPINSVHYPGEIEHSTALERAEYGIPMDDRLFNEL